MLFLYILTMLYNNIFMIAGEPKQSQVFSKVAYVFRDRLQLSSLLDCLRTRGTFASDECKEILRDHEQKYNRFYDKLFRLATTRKLTLLRSFYLSLLDSFEQCASSELDSNYSAAQHVRDAGKPLYIGDVII